MNMEDGLEEVANRQLF